LTDGVDSTSVGGFDEVREQFSQAGIVSYFIQIDTREFFEENLLGDCQSAMRFSAAQIRRYYRTFYPKSKVEKISGFCALGDFERLDISKRLYELADMEMNVLAKTSAAKFFRRGFVRSANGFLESRAGNRHEIFARLLLDKRKTRRQLPENQSRAKRRSGWRNRKSARRLHGASELTNNFDFTKIETDQFLSAATTVRFSKMPKPNNNGRPKTIRDVWLADEVQRL
jgi:hypothetical protein